MGDADYIHAFQKIVMPIAMEFAPELVMSKFARSPRCKNFSRSRTVSAGFDAAKGDPLGECLLSPTGYAHMTHMLSGLANGRLVVALEVSLVHISYYHLYPVGWLSCRVKCAICVGSWQSPSW